MKDTSLLFDRYIQQEIISQTNFSTVRRCFDTLEKRDVILKIVGKTKPSHPKNSPNKQSVDTISQNQRFETNMRYTKNECTILKKLQASNQNKDQSEFCGFPVLYDVLQFDSCFYIFMQPFRMNFQDLFHRCDCFFSEETIYFITCQMIDLVEKVHINGYVHRDIKPSNMCLESMTIEEYENKTGTIVSGKQTKNKREIYSVSIIDFGLSKSYIQKNGTHIPKKKQKGFTGNPKFASINALKNYTPCRMDDIEAVLYVILYFANTSCILPWEKSVKGKIDNDWILEQKYIFRSFIRNNLHDHIKLHIPSFLLKLFQITFDPMYEKQFDSVPPYDEFYKILGYHSLELSETRNKPIETLGDLNLTWETIDLNQ